MHEARLVRPDMLGQVRQEGDHVMLRHRSISSIRATSKVTSLARQTASAFSLGITPRAACASQAWASISNQMRKRVSGDQRRPFRAGVAGDHAAGPFCDGDGAARLA